MLHNLYESGNYQFLYAALIKDVNNKAATRLQLDYNLVVTPTCFFDGGNQVYVGGPNSDSLFANPILAAGQQPVPDVDLITRLDWLGDTQLQMKVGIGVKVPANQTPSASTAPIGVDEGLPGTVYEFEFGGSDPEGHQLVYRIDWGDSQISDWLGPYAAGETCKQTHAWINEGDYSVRVQARDVWDEMSDWSPAHQVSVHACCVGNRGNVDASPDDAVSLGDLTALIDVLFISLTPADCPEEANVDASLDGAVSLGDLTALIDVLFISLNDPPPCP